MPIWDSASPRLNWRVIDGSVDASSSANRCYVSIYHPHNLSRPLAAEKPFGIRVTLKASDPFRNLVGADWSREHWFATARERDGELDNMSQRYPYFRPGDQPSLEFEKIERTDGMR